MAKWVQYMPAACVISFLGGCILVL